MNRLSRPDNTKKWIIAGCACLLVLAGGAAAYLWHRGGHDPSKMTGDQIMAYVQTQDFNNLSREQRMEFGRQAFEKITDEHVATYAATPPDQRDAYLDKVIDEMAKYRETMRRFRPPFDPNGFRAGRDPNGAGGRDPNGMRNARNNGQPNWRNATPADRRARRETRDPVADTNRREFFGALAARAQQRGIQMGGFGRGGRGR